MFSGGKDSLAVLYLLEDFGCTNLEVIFIDTGKNFKELLDTVKYAKNRFTQYKFYTIYTNRTANWVKYGLPADAMNMDYSEHGNMFMGTINKFQTKFHCCYKNIMEPAWEYAKQVNCDVLIRGEKDSDKLKSVVKSGDTIEGILLYNPIEGWNDEQVRQYLHEKMGSDYPRHMDFYHSSLDCRDCTAYLKDTSDRVELLKTNYPEEYEIFLDNLHNIKQSLLEHLEPINNLLEK